MRYTKQVLKRREPRSLGHNPLGGWMVVALLLVTLVVCVTGWMSITDRYFGIAWVADLHNIAGHAIMLLAVLHWLGVAYTSWRHRENLVAAMLHGQKADDDLNRDAR
jgi:cytochrome b